MGARRFALVDLRDVARVAAAALMEEGHAGAAYVVSGPEALSYGDAAETIGAAIGKEVAYEPAEPQAFRGALVAERGLPRWRADELAFIASAYGEGEGESVTDAVRRVGAGGSVIDPEVVSRLVGRARRDNPLDALTDREREVLSLMAEGRSNVAISRIMSLSAKSIEGHVRNIFTKLNLMTTPDDHRRVLAVLTYLHT